MKQVSYFPSSILNLLNPFLLFLAGVEVVFLF
jgi:hypothetical protein